MRTYFRTKGSLPSEKILMECVLGDPAAVLPPVAQKRPVLPENCFPGAGEGIRTPDPLITNQMLYQLSYASKIGLPALPGAKGPPAPFLMSGTIF